MVGLRPESPVFNSAHRSEDCAPIDFSDQEVIVFLGDLIACVCWLGSDALALRQCEVKCHVCVFDKANIEISTERKKLFGGFSWEFFLLDSFKGSYNDSISHDIQEGEMLDYVKCYKSLDQS